MRGVVRTGEDAIRVRERKGGRERARERERERGKAAATYEAAKWSAINRTEWPLFLWAAAVNVHKTGEAIRRTNAPTSTGNLYKAVPRFGEFCFCCCSPLLPQLACSILATWEQPNRDSLYCRQEVGALYSEKFPLTFTLSTSTHSHSHIIKKRKLLGGAE